MPNYPDIGALTVGPESIQLEHDKDVLRRVAEETGYNFNDLWKIYGYESSFGTDSNMNKGTHQGPFQFTEDLANQLGIDRHDLYQSAKAFAEYAPTRRANLKRRMGNETGDNSFIESLDPFFLDYLLHQQGGLGTARMALAYGNDYFYYSQRKNPKHNVRYKMLRNLSDEQQKYLIDHTKSPKEAIDYYLQVTKKNLENR